MEYAWYGTDDGGKNPPTQCPVSAGGPNQPQPRTSSGRSCGRTLSRSATASLLLGTRTTETLEDWIRMDPEEWKTYWESLTDEERAEEYRMMIDYVNESDGV